MVYYYSSPWIPLVDAFYMGNVSLLEQEIRFPNKIIHVHTMYPMNKSRFFQDGCCWIQIQKVFQKEKEKQFSLFRPLQEDSDKAQQHIS